MFRNNIQFLQVVRNLKKYWHILYIVWNKLLFNDINAEKRYKETVISYFKW